MNDNPIYTKRCYKCDEPVRMSGPEFHRDPQWWTICTRCRAILNTEAKYACTVEPAPAEQSS